MEIKFHPLQFGATLKKKIDFIASQPQFKVYVKPLENLLFIRLLQQVKKKIFFLFRPLDSNFAFQTVGKSFRNNETFRIL